MTAEERAAQWAIDDAYWANYCGDVLAARRQMIRIADRLYPHQQEVARGQRKPQTPFR